MQKLESTIFILHQITKTVSISFFFFFCVFVFKLKFAHHLVNKLVDSFCWLHLVIWPSSCPMANYDYILFSKPYIAWPTLFLLEEISILTIKSNHPSIEFAFLLLMGTECIHWHPTKFNPVSLLCGNPNYKQFGESKPKAWISMQMNGLDQTSNIIWSDVHYTSLLSGFDT